MKRLVISLVLLALVLIASVLGAGFVEGVYKEIDRELSLGRELMEKGDAEGARAAAARAEEIFVGKEQLLGSVVDHGILDDLGRSLSAVAPFGEESSREEFLSHLRQAEIDLRHMRNDHAFIYGNLF